MSKTTQRALSKQQEGHRMWAMGLLGTPVKATTTATPRGWRLFNLGLKHAFERDNSGNLVRLKTAIRERKDNNTNQQEQL